MTSAVERFKQAHLLRVLEKTGGNKTKAAELLGIQRTHLSLLLRPKDAAGSSAD